MSGKNGVYRLGMQILNLKRKVKYHNVIDLSATRRNQALGNRSAKTLKAKQLIPSVVGCFSY